MAMCGSPVSAQSFHALGKSWSSGSFGEARTILHVRLAIQDCFQWLILPCITLDHAGFLSNRDPGVMGMSGMLKMILSQWTGICG